MLMFIVLSRAGSIQQALFPFGTSYVGFLAILSCDAQAKAASSVGGLPVAPVEPSPASRQRGRNSSCLSD